jgi:hypothetical protein
VGGVSVGPAPWEINLMEDTMTRLNLSVHDVPVSEFLKKMSLMTNVYQAQSDSSGEFWLAGGIRLGNVQIDVFSEHSKTRILLEGVMREV